MICLVIYATRTGNTRTIAEAIAAELRRRGTVHVLSVEEAINGVSTDVDLLVIGGPTEGHGVTEPMTACLDRLTAQPLSGLPVAVFDTRVWWPKALSGSAASGIAERLRAAGARLVVSPESFIVTMKPQLQPGEAERATAWAATLPATIEPREPVPA